MRMRGGVLLAIAAFVAVACGTSYRPARGDCRWCSCGLPRPQWHDGSAFLPKQPDLADSCARRYESASFDFTPHVAILRDFRVSRRNIHFLRIIFRKIRSPSLPIELRPQISACISVHSCGARLRMDRNHGHRRAAGGHVETMSQMERFRGHFYNWYDTRDLRPLDPKYISSVDSGNMAGHLLALANGCRELIQKSSIEPGMLAGVRIRSFCYGGAGKIIEHAANPSRHAKATQQCR